MAWPGVLALVLGQLSGGATMDPVVRGREAFQRGRYPEAQQLFSACLKERPKQCPTLMRALSAYVPLAGRADELTPPEAAELMVLDRVLTQGGEPSGKTHQVRERYVDLPLKRAKVALVANQLQRAATLAREVLVVEPDNAVALAVLEAAAPDGGMSSARQTADGGASRSATDGGRPR